MIIVNHLYQPFSHSNDDGAISLKKNERIAAIVGAILIGGTAAILGGSPVLLIAGVPVFYAITGYFKQRAIQQLHSHIDIPLKEMKKSIESEEEERPKSRLQTLMDQLERQDRIARERKRKLEEVNGQQEEEAAKTPRPDDEKSVAFNAARARSFHKFAKPDDVALQTSIQEEDLKVNPGPTRK